MWRIKIFSKNDIIVIARYHDNYMKLCIIGAFNKHVNLVFVQKPWWYKGSIGSEEGYENESLLFKTLSTMVVVPT